VPSYWEGTVVRLRAVEPDDWEIHHEWDQDSEMQRWLDRVHIPRSRQGTQRWAEQQALREPENDNFHFQVETLAGELVGSVNAHDCDRRTGIFEVGVAIRPEHQRKGYAREALALLLRYYFHELRYQKVNAYIVHVNEPSLRLFERLGFQQEGRLRRIVYTGGRHYDYIAYGMTIEEFDASGLIAPFADGGES
jgi:RimJ/RimL family protein N-acetyltransferase